MNKLFLAPTTLLDAAPLEFLAAAAEAGYDGVGVRLYRSPNLPFHPVVGDAALIRGIERALAGSRLAVLDIFTFYLQPQTDVRDFTPALELGAALGARYAVVQGDDPDWPRLARNFAAFCDDAARRGLVVAVEFMPARPLATLDLALRLLREAARPNVSILVDPLHLARSGGAPAALAGLDPALLPYAQFSDGISATAERRDAGRGRAAPRRAARRPAAGVATERRGAGHAPRRHPGRGMGEDGARPLPASSSPGDSATR